jgi:hypothetical protein
MVDACSFIRWRRAPRRSASAGGAVARCLATLAGSSVAYSQYAPSSRLASERNSGASTDQNPCQTVLGKPELFLLLFRRELCHQRTLLVGKADGAFEVGGRLEQQTKLAEAAPLGFAAV